MIYRDGKLMLSLQYPMCDSEQNSLLTEISQKDNLQRASQGHTDDNQRFVQKQGCRDYRRHRMPGRIHLHASMPPKHSVSRFMGYLKREECDDDFREACEPEVEVW